jgi:tRNA (guanine37-N1)-methyltransferase
MKIDIVSIFPGYFDVLELSLLGKAAKSKLVDVAVHDLRDATTDVHRSVDDTPYGGGAGMVMSPEPWGTMLDGLLQEDSWLIVPSPAGQLFTQGLATELSGASHLVFACGRYEGIDQRVIRALQLHTPCSGGESWRLCPERWRGRRTGDDRSHSALAPGFYGQP